MLLIVIGAADLRDAVAEGLGSRNFRSMVGIHDNLNLTRNRLEKQGKRKQEKLGRAHLHGPSIDEKSIQILGSLAGSVRLAENDRGDTTACAVLVVSEHDSLDGSCGFRKVFLDQHARLVLRSLQV